MAFRKLIHNVSLIWFALMTIVFVSGCNQQSQNWVTYDLDYSDLAKIWVYIIESDANGNVWVAQPAGKVLHIYQEHQRLTFSDIGAINAIAFNGKEHAWIATDSKIIVMDQHTYDVETAFPGEAYDVTVDSKGWVWAVTPDGVSIFDGIEWRTDELDCPVYHVDYLPNGSIAIDVDRRVWVTDGRCIHTYDDTGWASSELPIPLGRWSTQFVTDLEGLVWFVSGTGHILTCRNRDCIPLDEDLISVCDGISCVNTVVFDQENHLWIGTTKGAFSLRDDGEWSRFDKDNSGLQDNYVLSIAFDKRGWIWFGSRDEKISIFSPNEEPIVLPDEVQIVELAFAVPAETPTESQKSLLSLIKHEAAEYEIEVLEAYVKEQGVIVWNVETGKQEYRPMLSIEYKSKGKDVSDAELVRHELGVLAQLGFLVVEREGLAISDFDIQVYDGVEKRVGSIGVEADKIRAFQAGEISATEFQEDWFVFLDPDYQGPLLRVFR